MAEGSDWEKIKQFHAGTPPVQTTTNQSLPQARLQACFCRTVHLRYLIVVLLRVGASEQYTLFFQGCACLPNSVIGEYALSMGFH